ncbi:MAG TPA: aminopeptidase [Gammaproteobacteria bacterium]
MRSIVAMAASIPAFLLSGCALPYYWQAASGQLDLLSRRVPISEVIDDPDQSDETRAALQRALRMREYAVSSLGLPENDSYRSYADLGRRFAVWNVVAAAEFSVDPVNWCFPIAGCVSYRGYFSEEDAERYAARLRDDGYDTYVAGVTAYSTLGYFSDPLLNTMLPGGDSYVAGIIFHELAHQRSYIRGDTAVNEAFATAVSEFGTERWLEMTADVASVAEHRARADRREVFFDLITRYQDRLRSIYESPVSDAEKRVRKTQTLGDLVAEYETLKASWGGVSDYDSWFSQPLNNAQLASVVAYSRWLPNLRAYLDMHGLQALYAEMAVLEGLSPAEREGRLRGYLAAAPSPEPG